MELIVAENWIYAQLSTDPALSAISNGVFPDTAPEETPFPFVVFDYVSGFNAKTMNCDKVMVELVYQVKAIGQTRAKSDLQPIVDRITALLHTQRGSTTGGRVISCVEERPISYPEPDRGTNYYHLGAEYRLQVQAS